jgi:hypothetical protein
MNDVVFIALSKDIPSTQVHNDIFDLSNFTDQNKARTHKCVLSFMSELPDVCLCFGRITMRFILTDSGT